MNLCTVTKLAIAIVGYFRLSGHNRGIDGRHSFRAKPLRLALPWVQDEAGCFAHASLLHVIARPCQGPWQSVPFRATARVGTTARTYGPPYPRGYPRGGPQFHLAALPFPGLLRDGPPKARLRSGESAFLCHRQRRLLRPPLAVSIREVLRRGRIRNLPLLSVLSFATFLWTSKEKLTPQE